MGLSISSVAMFLKNSLYKLHFSKENVNSWKQRLRWLDWIFWGWYLPSLSIDYVGMSKDMEKRLPQLYYIKMRISYDLDFIAIGVAMATTWKQCQWIMRTLACKHKIWEENWLYLRPYLKAFPVFNVLKTCREYFLTIDLGIIEFIKNFIEQFLEKCEIFRHGPNYLQKLYQKQLNAS